MLGRGALPHHNMRYCAKCGGPLFTKRNGVWVELMGGDGNPEKVHADVLGCSECDTAILTGFARRGIPHDDPRYDDIKADYRVGVMRDRREES